MDQEHIELVKQHGDGLAETIRGLDHTARHDYITIYTLFPVVLLIDVNFFNEMSHNAVDLGYHGYVPFFD